MHLHAGAVQLQYFMPQQGAAADSATACSASTSPAAATTMWEYHQLAHPALQPSSSFPYSYWSPYSGSTTTATALLAGSAFAADSSSTDVMRLHTGEHAHGHGWSHGELSNSTTGYRENFLDLLASKNVTPEMFEEVPITEHYNVATARAFDARSDDVSPIKYEISGSQLFLGGATTNTAGLQVQEMSMMSGMPACYDDAEHHHHQLTKEGSSNQQQAELAINPMASFLQQISSGSASIGVHSSLDYSALGEPDKICQDSREMEASPFSMRSLPDLGSFAGYTSTIESTSVQPYMRCANSSDSNRQEQETVPARSSSSGSAAATDRKKRKSEERQESTGKKSKQEASKASPPKQPIPKVKLGEKITALQQIVSPFGKTDTASVLFETIKYIKFLHEQVQLLSEPYTNSSRSKGNSVVVPWGDQAEASKGETGHDLKNRGLCLVPVSWTPEVYRDGTSMDYWTPAYRGCLYR
ncbi:transcription factor bHLH133-like [Oryza brachyantha]|uniref:BHLH domain-containing protein n=1 Tax=Oryza brachyantha TaxID=4533 RepID=J3LFR0_ORYBR|nr:transcription factor bHLH133-like [Oryza brachyantha]